MMKREAKSSEHIAKLDKLTRGIKVAMMITVTDDGLLRSRPMATLDREFDGEFWFFTDGDANKVHEIKREHEVNLAYSDPSENRYISVSGRADLIKDRRKIRKLWSPSLTTWFPKGLSDPNLALLRVRVESAEYWTSPTGAPVGWLGFARSVLSGERFRRELPEHEKLELRA